MNHPGEPRLRNLELDILRCIAILLVLGRHADGPHLWVFSGWVGVDLFFVLSGFLISGLLFSEYKATGNIGWKRFFIRRGFKIYPAYYAMILTTVVWQVANGHIQWRLFQSEIFMFQNYAARVWPHTWSLAVEEHFYIFLPVLLLLLLSIPNAKDRSDPFRGIPYVCLTIGIVCLLLRLHLVLTLPDLKTNWAGVLFPSHLRFDSLFFGVFLGYLHHFSPQTLLRLVAARWSRITLLLVSLLLIAPCAIFPVNGSRFMLSLGLSFLYLGFGGILILALYGRRKDLVVNPSRPRTIGIAAAAAYVGKYSYSIYLWHINIGLHDQFFFRLLWPQISGNTLFLANIITEIFGGIILSLAIEWPALRFRDRFFPAFQKSASSAQAALEPISA